MKVKRKVDKKLAARIVAWATTVNSFKGKGDPSSAFRKPGSRKRKQG